MRILITGSSGFIGGHVVQALAEDGHTLVLIDRNPRPFVESRCSTSWEHDIDLRELSSDHCVDVEAVVHLAALGGVARAEREPEAVVDANVRGTMRLIAAAQSSDALKHFIHASSFSVYGSNYEYHCDVRGHKVERPRRAQVDLDAGRYEVMCHGFPATIIPCDERMEPAPLEPYGVSKLMQELCYRGTTNAPVSILRFSSVYGRNMRSDSDSATIIAKIAAAIRAGKRPQLLEDGCQIRDWVHVNDVIDAIRACLAAPMSRTINVCSGIPQTLSGACIEIAKAMCRDIKPEIVGGYRPGDMRHCLGDDTGFRYLVGRPPTRFEVGVKEAFGVPG